MTGLRERKKQRTREGIVEAALALFERRGYDETTIDDVAEAAQVSPRTVFRYFTSKEDLVFLGQDEENRRVAALILGTPRGAAPIDTLMHATRTVLLPMQASSEQIVRSHRLIQRTPALRAYKGKLFQTVEELITSALVPAHGTRREALQGRMLAAVYLAALEVAISSWVDDGAKGTPAAELDLVEALLRRAFPDAAAAAASRGRPPATPAKRHPGQRRTRSRAGSGSVGD
jgi:AcrR family transcriptional regulator